MDEFFLSKWIKNDEKQKKEEERQIPCLDWSQNLFLGLRIKKKEKKKRSLDGSLAFVILKLLWASQASQAHQAKKLELKQ